MGKLKALVNKLQGREDTSKKAARMDHLKIKDTITTDHMIPIEELLKMLGTNMDWGLSEDEAARRLHEQGLNRLTPPKEVSKLIKFLRQLFGGFSLLLWVGAILCIIAYFVEKGKNVDQLYLGVVLIFVVVVTGMFTYLQEAKSSAIMQSFGKMIAQNATVIREGKQMQINSENLVRGDVVEFKGGDRVPADIRVVHAQTCKVDNSSLTGESEPQSRVPNEMNKMYIESRNIAFFSTNCMQGWAKGVVLLTGDHTAMGSIAHLTANLSSGDTPIAKEISHFIRIITYFAVVIGVVFFIISLAYGYQIIEAVVFFIAIIVANVPEGLLATLTVCLRLTARRMARKACLVTNLEAVETLGSTSTICSDKTGTLTQNRMTVSHLWISDRIVDAEKLEEHPKVVDFVHPRCMFDLIALVLSLCSKAEFGPNQEHIAIKKRVTMGDASESAILKFMQTVCTVGPMEVRARLPRVTEIAFNSFNKFHLTVHKDVENKRNIVLLKGAPERVLERCSTYQLDGEDDKLTKSQKIDAKFTKQFNDCYKQLGGLGERAIGLAYLFLPPDQYPLDFQFDAENLNFPATNLQYAGIISMVDPPRPGVHSAVMKCREAGIRVVMVTGDHPHTARAIARAVGIISPNSVVHNISEQVSIRNVDDTLPKHCRQGHGNAIVVTGAQMLYMDDKQLDHVTGLFDEVVFARTSPQQKLSIVESLQRKHEVVAVTGDGVNDSPALKKADIGIAMGISGSDVCKQAADMILLDDNFASIVVGVEEGRIVFDNLKKSIAYTLTSNIAEITPFLVYIVAGIPLPLSTVTILCIDVGTDIVPAISLAYEPAESDIMRRKPRTIQDRLVNNRLIALSYGQIGFIQAFAGFMAYFGVMGEHGFFLTHLLNIRTEWDDKNNSDLLDHYGQEWSYAERKRLESTCQTAFFIAIVVTQWFDVIICKTRGNSLVQQGLRNEVLNFSLIFETCAAVFLCYSPGMNVVLKVFPLRIIWWTFGLPYGILLFVYDECRRFMVRHYPGGFMQCITYY